MTGKSLVAMISLIVDGQACRSPRRRWRCGWHGLHIGPVSVGVIVGRDCGHSDGKATPTCQLHLEHLLSQGGCASKAVACPVCGVLGTARVIRTLDLSGARARAFSTAGM